MRFFPVRDATVAKPRVASINRLSITTFQIVNFLFLLWWGTMLLIHYQELDQSEVVQTVGRGLPSVFWLAVVAILLALTSASSFSSLWVQTVNRTYKTKILSLSLSSSWWGFLSTIFLLLDGVNLNFGLYAILSIAAMFEASRIRGE